MEYIKETANKAREILHRDLKEYPNRIKHCERIGNLAYKAALKIKRNNPNLDVNPYKAMVLGLLHDIGYSKKYVHTGFHQIDGAAAFRKLGLGDLCNEILSHSSSFEEAKLRKIKRKIPFPETIEGKLLTFYDSQVLQGGRKVSFEKRIKDIIERYSSKDPKVALGVKNAKPRLEKLNKEMNSYLREGGRVVRGT